MTATFTDNLPTIGASVLAIGVGLAIGYGYPGASGKVLAAVLFAFPFLALTVFAGMAEGFYAGFTGTDTGNWALTKTLPSAGFAAGAGAVLAAFGGWVRGRRTD